MGTLSPLGAQTTTTPATCTVAPTTITALSLERVLTLSNLLSTITPTVAPNILAGIAGGAQEIRDRLIYNPSANTLTDTVFLVAAGSPIPTPLSMDVSGTTLQSFTLNVSQIFTSCKPLPSLVVAGTISASSSAFGSFLGAPAIVSLGYTTDSPAKVNNVVTVVSGAVVAYSAAATGSLTFPAVPVTPPGSNAGAPVIATVPSFPATGVSQVGNNPFQVSAAGSTDPNSLALTYLWTSDAGHPVNFLPSNTSASPQLYFQSGRGDYTITLTVTNSAGVSAKTSFVIEYIGIN
jgi:hypothetical protein